MPRLSQTVDSPYSPRLLHMIQGIESTRRGLVVQRARESGVWLCRTEPTPDGVWFRPEAGRLRLLPQVPNTSSSTIGQTH